MFWKNVWVARCYFQEWKWTDWTAGAQGCSAGQAEVWAGHRQGTAQLPWQDVIPLSQRNSSSLPAFCNAPRCWQMEGFGTQQGAISVAINTHCTLNEAGTGHRLLSQVMKMPVWWVAHQEYSVSEETFFFFRKISYAKTRERRLGFCNHRAPLMCFQLS